MLTGQSGYALPAKYRPLHRVSRRKAGPFLEVQLPPFQRGGVAESDPSRKFNREICCAAMKPLPVRWSHPLRCLVLGCGQGNEAALQSRRQSS